MMAIKLLLLFLLFVGYTLACIADAPDVKPLWKHWLGGKLESYANQLKPINYCHKALCPFIKRVNTPQIHFISDTLEKNVMIDEGEMFEVAQQEEFNRRYNKPIPTRFTRQYKINEGKEMCTNAILEAIPHYIDIKVDEDSYYPGVVIHGELVVGKKEFR